MSKRTAFELTRRDVLRLGLAAGAAALGPWACAPAGTTARVGGTLTYAHSTSPANLDPIASSSIAQNLYHALFDCLYFKDDGKLVPQLATSYKLIDDKTWEFKLRTGVNFHNGEAFNAAAVKFSIDRFLDPKQKAGSASRLTEVSGVEVVDDSTVRIHTKNPFPVLLLGLNWAFILPPKYTAENPELFGQQPVGTGPFKFVEWKQGDHLTMAANESYFLGRPKLDKVVYRVIPDDVARFAALKAGEIDIDENLPIDAIDEAASDPNLNVLQMFQEAGQIFEFDTLRGGPTANSMVRQALNYAVDKDTINKTLLRGKFRPLAGQLLTDGILGFDPDTKMFPYDPGMAKQLLTAAGYPNGFDTEINGPAGFYVGDRDILAAVADQFGKVGVRAKVNALESGQWINKIAANQAGPMFFVGWFSNGDPQNALTWLTSESGLGKYVADPTFDSLAIEGERTVDPDKRKSLYLQASRYMHDQALALFMFQPAYFWGVKKRVSGFEARTFINLYPVSVQ